MKQLREIHKQNASILDDNLELRTGVFQDYFKEFNLIQKKRGFFKKQINKNLLTEWQAVEVLEKDVFMICAVFKFGIMNRTLFFVYDIKNNELHNYSSTSYLKNQSSVASSLEKMSFSTRSTKKTSVIIGNELEKGIITLKGFSDDCNFDIECTRIGEPSVVGIPMTKKHTVYTEKDWLTPKGVISFKGTSYQLNDSHFTILDDHRGYYPLTSGYDWVTCMGEINLEGSNHKFGINLTYFYKNLDHNLNNENGYWFDGKFFQLPVVTFYREEDIWKIKDQNGIVNITFKRKNDYVERKKIPISIDYTLAFGEMSGEIVTENGVIEFHKLFALGEKRNTKFIK